MNTKVNNSLQYETVIGLEIHVQLISNSKAFSADANDYIAESNTNISPISLAHPGTLPKANAEQVYKAIKLGIALDCVIAKTHVFDRKHYFYPDLPKGYQLTQDRKPYCTGGKVSFISDGTPKTVRLHHIHMEEDAGKSIHAVDGSGSLIDYNRAGVPLLEIVTEPDFRSGQEVYDFLTELQRIVQYLDISDANMEEGSFRCDCNVSVRAQGDPNYGERCEIKNQNSRRYAKQAIEFEAQRQIDLLSSGQHIIRSTMLFDPNSGQTRPMRSKESVNDYRYFPDPDLPPMTIDPLEIAKISKQIPALPYASLKNLIDNYQISFADADVIVQDRAYVDSFLALAGDHDIKVLSYLYVHKILPYVIQQEIGIHQFLNNANISDIVQVLSSPQISKSAALQHIVPVWLQNPKVSAMDIATRLDLIQKDDQSFLDSIIIDVLAASPEKVADYKKGKKGLIGFFMGQVKGKSSGQADPKVMQQKLEKALEK
jgi:aspartyl-tRNA(Asn)/glutamyl-tRNA(Gln) amidotransferase subunit B